ncbi:MAG: apolipoprotein N-acyltransferase [Bradymonadia bacterium]
MISFNASFYNVLNHASGRYAFALLSGILNGVAFIWVGSISFIANVPLLLALMKAPRLTERIWLGALVGFFAGLHIYGIAHYGWFLLITFATYTASQMMLYGIGFHYLWRGSPPWCRLALPVVLWTLTEWIRTLGPFSMPASYVGNIALDQWLAPWLFLSPHLGGLFVSACIALIQTLVFLAIVDRRHYRPQIFVGFGIFITLGVIGLLTPPNLGSDLRSTVSVQSGLHNNRYAVAKVDPFARQEIIDTFAVLSTRAYSSLPDYVFWPETAIRSPIFDNESLMDQLFPPKNQRTTLIAGLPIRRDSKRYNAALAILQHQIKDESYKIKLVMGTEDHFTPGQVHTPLHIGSDRVGVMICLEAVYPRIGQSLAAQGAQFLLVLSNDAGFGYSPITHHMTRRAVMRALETGRWLVRVGQAGLSVIVNPRGEVQQSLDLFTPALMSGNVQLRDDQTFYVQYPNFFPQFTLAALVFLILVASNRRRKLDNA